MKLDPTLIFVGGLVLIIGGLYLYFNRPTEEEIPPFECTITN